MSIREIARMTGLSITTVSHAINGTRPVSEKSRRLVEEAIRRTGYRPNLAARALKTQKSNIIALIIPSTEPGNSTNCFFFDVLGGVKDTLQRRGYDLIVSTYSERRSDIRLDSVSVLKKSWIDGLLLVPNSRHSRYDELLAGVDLPTVLLDRRLDGCDLPLVCCDNESAAEQAVGLLADSGRARIGYLGGALDLSTAYDRYAGYRRALETRGLPLDPGLVRLGLDYSIEAGREAARELVGQGADAVFAANSVLTMGLVKYLGGAGIAIPGRVAVVGFDDYDWTEIANPPITAVRQSAFAMGAKGAEMLIGLIEGREPPERTVLLPAGLTLRESHGPAQP